MKTRRTFLRYTVSSLTGVVVAPALVELIAEAAPLPKIRIGTCRLDLAQAKQAGVEGVEIPIREAVEKLRISDPSVRQEYKEQMKQTGAVVSSLMMSILNSNPLATDPRGPGWLEQCIDAAQDLGAGVILVAFFGKGNLLEDGQLKPADAGVVVERLKAAAPRAARAGVILAIENTLSARQNAQILERIGHASVRVYYDVGNSTRNGYDVPEEIRFLKDRIACIHFKDGNSYLGEGAIQFEPIAAAIREIGYQGWIIMETSNPSKDGVADARRNAEYIRTLFGTN